MSDKDKFEVFNESQLKKIKKEFSAGPHSGQQSWLQLCDVYLKTQIALADQDLTDRRVEYISPNDPNMKDVVVPDRLHKKFKNYHFPNH